MASRCTIVRRAEFRESFAVSNRLWLFDEPEEDRTGKPQYLLLLHGPSGVKGEPGFIELVERHLIRMGGEIPPRTARSQLELLAA